MKRGHRRELRWPHRADLGAALGLAALTAVLFKDALFRDRVLYERDIQAMVYAQIESFVRCVATGSWPVWNPYGGFGQPLLANPGSQVLYPWTWLNLLISPASFYTVYVTSHVFLTGLGLYAFARRLGLSRVAGLVAASVWMTSGPVLSLVSLWQHFAGAAWIPWVLLAADRALATPGVTRALTWGVATAAQLFAGSVEMVVATTLLEAAWTLKYLRLLQPMAPDNRRVLGSAVLAGAFAFALSAAQWLPALAFVRGTGRTALPDWVQTYWSLHPVNLVQLFLPVVPRDLPLRQAVLDRLFESREPFLNSIYLGLGTLPLALASFLGPRRRAAAFFAGTAVTATLLALGRHALPYYFAVSLLPILRVFRYPSKAMVVAAFAWALLVGLGLDAARQEEKRRPGRWLLLVFLPASLVAALVGMVAFGLTFRAEAWGPLILSSETGRTFTQILAPTARTGWLAAAAAGAAMALLLGGLRRRPWAPGLAATAGIVAAFELGWAHHDLNPTAPREVVMRPPAAVAVLRAEQATRVYAFDYMQRVAGRAYRRETLTQPVPPPGAGMPLPLWRWLARQDHLSPPTGERWGFFGSFEYDGLALQPRPLRNLNLVSRASEETPDFVRLLRVASVSHVIGLHTVGLEGLIPVATLPSPFAGDVHIFRVPDPLPRIYLVGASRIANGLPALKALADPGFDPAREVVLPEGSPPTASPGFSGEAHLVAYRPDRLRIATRVGQPAYLVVVDAYDAGWRATIDGRDAPVLRANVAFRAVPVPAGEHLVELSYRPRSVTWGLLVSGVAALLGLAGAARSSSSSRRASPNSGWSRTSSESSATAPSTSP